MGKISGWRKSIKGFHWSHRTSFVQFNTTGLHKHLPSVGSNNYKKVRKVLKQNTVRGRAQYEYFSILYFPHSRDETSGTMKVETVTVSLLLIMFLLTFTPGNGQTFQYSRGWTNGKRSDPFPAYGEHSEAPWNSDDIASNYRLQFIDL